MSSSQGKGKVDQCEEREDRWLDTGNRDGEEKRDAGDKRGEEGGEGGMMEGINNN